MRISICWQRVSTCCASELYANLYYHTHGDINAAFAHRWCWLRQHSILTIDGFKNGVEKHFVGKLKATVDDIYVLSARRLLNIAQNFTNSS